MEKRTREILALVLLVVLGIAAVCAMAWYMLVGHNWNQAATHIDDLVGSMDGYTVIVYDGVVEKEIPVPKTKPTAFTLAAQAARIKQVKTWTRKEDFTGLKYVSPVEVAESYREKGAAVIQLAPLKGNRFDEPSIIRRNGKRYGIFSFSGKYRYRYPELRANIRYLQRHRVDSIILLAKDKTLLKRHLGGVDMLVMERETKIGEGGEYRGKTFCVDSPFIGEVQAVIVSPSGVMTSRTIRDL